MALLKFLKGNYSSLNTAAIAEGQVLICGDTGEMFVDVAADKRVKIGDFVVIDTLANLEALNAAEVPTSRLYYVEDGNILARSNGSAWTQINKQPTADQIKTMIGLADYETKADAAQKLTDANDYTDTEVAKVQGEVDDLEKYVGTIPDTAEATDIVGYVQEKTAGIATDTALEELTGRVKTAEDEIDDLQAALAENGSTATAIATAQAAAEAADAKAVAADGKAVQAQNEVDALETVVANYKTANDAAVAAAKKAGDDAQADVDALEIKVGEIPEGETVASMIGDANDAAAGAMREALAKVASVTAGDASITVGGTATAPTVAAKLSADADNALTLAEDGLKVVIPAAAEYTIVKAEDSGDYAAIYNLTKNGTIVGASINIPKDLVVKSGSVVDGNIVLVLNDEANTEITIPADSLIEYVTSGSATGDMVVINVSDDHKVTATITDGTIGAEKLTTDVQTKINKAHSHENADVLAGITADQVAAWDQAEANVIETVKVNGEALTIDGKAVDIAVPTGALASKDEVSKDDLDDTLAAEINAKAVASEVNTALDGKVDKVEGKSLVDDAEIEKLAGVSDGANKVEASETNGNIKIDGVETVVYTHPDEHAISEITGLEDALAAKLEADDIANKADKATTLEGYGITDAMTADEINALLTWGSF